MAERERKHFGTGVLQAAEEDGRSRKMMLRASAKYVLPFLALCAWSLYKLLVSG